MLEDPRCSSRVYTPPSSLLTCSSHYPHTQVTELYYKTGALSFAAVSLCLLVGQFAVVWSRVLPYLYVTYGGDSLFYRLFLYLGMPAGCFFFDALMFLGPFGLLPVIPMPEAMRLFVPACACRHHPRRHL